MSRIIQGTHGTGKTGKWPNIFPVRENTGNLDILPKLWGKNMEFLRQILQYPFPLGSGNLQLEQNLSKAKLDRSAKAALCM